MTASIRDISHLLRQGNLIALADETGWSVAADPIHGVAVDALLALRAELLTTGAAASAMATPLLPTVLIQDAGQLSLYVVKPAEVAYDLVDFAEDPLTVLFAPGKNVAPALLAQTPTAELALRRSLRADVQRLIGGFGRGLLTVPLDAPAGATDRLPPAIEAAVAGQYGTVPARAQRPKLMRLGAGGEVEFLRK